MCWLFCLSWTEVAHYRAAEMSSGGPSEHGVWPDISWHPLAEWRMSALIYFQKTSGGCFKKTSTPLVYKYWVGVVLLKQRLAMGLKSCSTHNSVNSLVKSEKSYDIIRWAPKSPWRAITAMVTWVLEFLINKLLSYRNSKGK